MTARELAFYQWLESVTLGGDFDTGDECWQLSLAKSRKYVRQEQKRDTMELTYVLTDLGRDWFVPRSQAIVEACGSGNHQFAPKTPQAECLHCRWCGACELLPCAECDQWKKQPGETPALTAAHFKPCPKCGRLGEVLAGELACQSCGEVTQVREPPCQPTSDSPTPTLSPATPPDLATEKPPDGSTSISPV